VYVSLVCIVCLAEYNIVVCMYVRARVMYVSVNICMYVCMYEFKKVDVVFNSYL